VELVDSDFIWTSHGSARPFSELRGTDRRSARPADTTKSAPVALGLQVQTRIPSAARGVSSRSLKKSNPGASTSFETSSPRSTPQDEVFYLKHLAYTEETQRALSKHADKGSLRSFGTSRDLEGRR
jgi:hypothetical protein